MSSLFKLPTLASVYSAHSNNTMVTTRSATRARSRLAELPTELLLQVFQSAESFKAASNLALTSRQFYGIWRQHLTPIYEAIAPTCIIEHSALREFLVDLGQITPSTTINLEYIACVVKGSKIGDKLVKEYHANTEEHPYHDPQVPKTLSLTETRRFVRAMYQILGLLSIDKDNLDERIQKLSLKNLFLLSDFLCVFDGRAIEDTRLREILDSDPYPYAPHSLQRHLRSHRNLQFRELYDHKYRPINDTPYEQNGRHAWWCDRQQTTFRNLLTGRVYTDAVGKVDMSKVRDDLWYDSGEE
ncbi:uncharacterized protein BDV17DRAFT_203201 [Aspergillus undulatus]|uniref:uncharacterized protein n=1 Tax=Aspergillus undulatus TaxID=1810928 RepID=UPI003CCE30E0